MKRGKGGVQVTWRHTVAGDIGGAGIGLGRGLAQLPGAEPVGGARPA